MSELLTKAEKRKLADRLFREMVDPRYVGVTSKFIFVVKLLVLITDELWGPGETEVEKW